MHVRFTPNSGHVQCTSSCLLWANSGHRSTPLSDQQKRGEKDGQSGVKYDRGPQEDAHKVTGKTNIRKIQHDQCAVDQHAEDWRAWPAGKPQPYQGKTGYARYWYCDVSKLLIKQ